MRKVIRRVMRRVMRRVAIRAMRGAMKSTMRIAVRGAMKRGAVWAGVSVLSLSQASFAAGAHDTQRFNPANTTLALQVGQTPIQDEQSRTVSMLEAAQLRGKVLPFIVGVVTVDLALASFYWGVYVPYYAEQEAPQ
jgi:methylmalonyl-CoA mutase cobalamin-binding subunit